MLRCFFVQIPYNFCSDYTLTPEVPGRPWKASHPTPGHTPSKSPTYACTGPGGENKILHFSLLTERNEIIYDA